MNVQAGDFCPSCEVGTLKNRTGPFGNFLGCSVFAPTGCKYKFSAEVDFSESQRWFASNRIRLERDLEKLQNEVENPTGSGKYHELYEKVAAVLADGEFMHKCNEHLHFVKRFNHLGIYYTGVYNLLKKLVDKMVVVDEDGEYHFSSRYNRLAIGDRKEREEFYGLYNHDLVWRYVRRVNKVVHPFYDDLFKKLVFMHNMFTVRAECLGGFTPNSCAETLYPFVSKFDGYREMLHSWLQNGIETELRRLEVTDVEYQDVIEYVLITEISKRWFPENLSIDDSVKKIKLFFAINRYSSDTIRLRQGLSGAVIDLIMSKEVLMKMYPLIFTINDLLILDMPPSYDGTVLPSVPSLPDWFRKLTACEKELFNRYFPEERAIRDDVLTIPVGEVDWINVPEKFTDLGVKKSTAQFISKLNDVLNKEYSQLRLGDLERIKTAFRETLTFKRSSVARKVKIAGDFNEIEENIRLAAHKMCAIINAERENMINNRCSQMLLSLHSAVFRS